MLMPKRVKRRKQFRGSMRGKALRGNKINEKEEIKIGRMEEMEWKMKN